MIEPLGPVAVSVARSTPRSLASLRTGGFASTRTSRVSTGSTTEEPGSTAEDAACDAGTAGSSASRDVGRLGAALTEGTLHLHLGAGDGLAGRRRGALADPALRAAIGLVATDQALALTATAGGRVGQVHLAEVRQRRRGGRRVGGGCGLGRRGSSPIRMIGVPTATVSPSGTSSALTTPAYGDGSSTSDFAVSISTTMSLIAIVSPTFTFQVTISASVRPSPDVGQEVLRHVAPQKSNVRSTASSTRSRSGR